MAEPHRDTTRHKLVHDGLMAQRAHLHAPHAHPDAARRKRARPVLGPAPPPTLRLGEFQRQWWGLIRSPVHTNCCRGPSAAPSGPPHGELRHSLLPATRPLGVWGLCFHRPASGSVARGRSHLMPGGPHCRPTFAVPAEPREAGPSGSFTCGAAVLLGSLCKSLLATCCISLLSP